MYSLHICIAITLPVALDQVTCCLPALGKAHARIISTLMFCICLSNKISWLKLHNSIFYLSFFSVRSTNLSIEAFPFALAQPLVHISPRPAMVSELDGHLVVVGV